MVAEVIITGGGWTVLAGLEEVAHLLAGKDVIERDGEPCAKSGKRGGKKQVYRGSGTIRAGNDVIRLAKEAPPKDKVPLLQPMILKGNIVADFSFSVEEARKRVQEQIRVIEGASI